MTELSAYVQELYDKGRLTHYEYSVMMHLIEVASGRMHRVLKAKQTARGVKTNTGCNAPQGAKQRGDTNAWN